MSTVIANAFIALGYGVLGQGSLVNWLGCVHKIGARPITSCLRAADKLYVRLGHQLQI